jgi:hypothetical protein
MNALLSQTINSEIGKPEVIPLLPHPLDLHAVRVFVLDSKSNFGQWTEIAFGKALCLHGKRAVKSRPIVLPSDDGSQFGQLGFREAAAQTFVERIGNICRCASELHRQP